MFMIYVPILYFVTYVILGGKENFQQNQIAIFICFFLYAFIDSLLCSTLRQTPGMKAQELVLNGENGKKVNFFIAFARFVLFCLSFALLFGFFFPFMRKDRQTFHDWICKTTIQKIQN